MRAPIAIMLITPFVLVSLPAAAQNPSADQIINSLRPSGNTVMGGTRGIRLGAPSSEGSAQSQGAPAAAQSQPPAHIASSKPASAADNPTVNLTVNFATGSAELTPDATRTLDELGHALASKDLAAYRFRIEGHTDTVGTREYNQALSERRAQAVVQYVAKTYGVDPGRLQAVGMGETGLLVQTPPQTPELRNRRVQVINLGT